MRTRNSLTSRTLFSTAIRIGLVSLCVGAVSYFINLHSIEDKARQQLELTEQQALQREAIPFKDILDAERDFIGDFNREYENPVRYKQLVSDFDLIFYRHKDGSYTQKPGVFEGQSLSDGRQFKDMSATYAPDVQPDEDVKARFALSFMLSYKYGSSSRGHIFNFYGVVPEKGFPIYQNANVGEAFGYEGPEALDLNEFEFYTRGFDKSQKTPFFTKMYWDASNNGWMTTISTPDSKLVNGKRPILACSDVLLSELMHRVAHPALTGSYGSLFLPDADGTLVFAPDHVEDIKSSAGSASIKSLGLTSYYPILDVARKLKQGEVKLVDTEHEIVAVGLLPGTPWIMTTHYPKMLMRPAILQNIAIVIATGLLTLLVEIFIIRSVLINQVSRPLTRLIQAVNVVGKHNTLLANNDLPVDNDDEIGELARDFHSMATRVRESHMRLEEKIRERTEALEAANQKLLELSATDGLTGIANRRRFDEALSTEWRRAIHHGSRLTLAMIDVDYFKNYNDHYGHVAGDECLKQIAKILKQNAQRGADFVARYGGEEFVILMAEANEDSGERLLAKIQQAVREADITHAHSPFGQVTISAGLVSVVPEQKSEPEMLVTMADKALYKAKETGRNRSCWSTDTAA